MDTINFGFIQIKLYSLLILLAFFLGYIYISKEAKKNNINKDVITDLICYMIPICILGARIYYVVFEWDYYSSNLADIFKIWEGGLAIHGGIIAGFIFLVYFSKKKNLNLLQLTNMIVPALILGQAIGRWGNFFNQEAFGPITTYSYLKHLHIPNFIIQGMYIGGHYHQPTFLYESVWCFIGFVILIVLKKFKFKNLTSIYLIYYGIGRFLIESLRQDSLMFLNLKMAQIVSIIMILIGIVLLVMPNKTKNVYKKV